MFCFYVCFVLESASLAVLRLRLRSDKGSTLMEIQALTNLGSQVSQISSLKTWGPGWIHGGGMINVLCFDFDI